MRASVAFAVGLWTGGLLVGAVWVFHHSQQSPPAPVRGRGVPLLSGASMNAELRRLAAENARLQADAERLRQAYEDLLATPVESAAAVPPPPPTETVTVPLLEDLARHNKQSAVEELVLGTDENFQALLRLARSTDVSERHRTAIETYLAGIVEQFLNERMPAE